MRASFLVGLLAAVVAGCGMVGPPPVPPSPSSAPSSAVTATSRTSAPSPSTRGVGAGTAPRPSLSLLQMREAFLVVWSKYHHLIDQIDYRHLRKTGPDYQAWCQETDEVDLEYIGGIGLIQFGLIQAEAAQDLVARSEAYDAALQECAAHVSIRQILKVVPSITKARAMQADAESTLRTALNLKAR